nr:hypothetical protein [Izhakiella capsodis]
MGRFTGSNITIDRRMNPASGQAVASGWIILTCDHSLSLNSGSFVSRTVALCRGAMS